MVSRRKSSVSHALWISLIWMLYSAAKPISLWIEGGIPARTETLEDKPLDRNVLIVLMVLSLIVLIKRNVKWRAILKSNFMIVLFFSYCGISIAWADFPMVSFKRWIKEIGLFLSILVVLTENDPLEAVKTLIKRFSYIVISFSVLLIIYFPKIGMDFTTYADGSLSYQGVAWNKNGLGRICLVSGIFFFWNLVTIKRTKISINKNTQIIKNEGVLIQYLFLMISLSLLIMVNSATSLAGLIIGMGILVALGSKAISRNAKNLGIFVVIAIIIGLALQLSFDLIEMFVTSQGRDLTFTGRVPLWKDLLAFHTNPLFGVGFGSFWLGDRLTTIWEKYVWLPNESHNGYLNIYLELGLVGLFLLAGIIINSFRNFKKALINDFDYGRFQIAILLISMIYNLMEDGFGKLNLIWFIFLLITVNIPNKISLNESYKPTKFI